MTHDVSPVDSYVSSEESDIIISKVPVEKC